MKGKTAVFMEDTDIKKIIIKKGFNINEDEEFKECLPRFPNYYISNQGRCFSTLSMKFLKPGISGKVKKNQTERDGYKFVSCQLGNSKNKLMYIHRLVAETFYPDENFKLWVNHKNKNRMDNELINLEFVLPKKNIELGLAIAINVRNTVNQEEISFVSISAASRFLGLTYYSIYHALSSSQIVNNYEFKKI